MFVDIHTHHKTVSEFPSIRNLEFSEAEKIFSSDKEGSFSLGFHPWFGNDYSKEAVEKLTIWANDKRMVVLGECGLDKNSRLTLEQQILIFEEQIRLSELVAKPLIIHCVGYFNELFEIKKKLKPIQLWIIHGFRGKPELAKQALEAGCAISFGERFNEKSVKETPINKLFVETDESNILIDELYKRLSIIKLCCPEELNAGNLLLQTLSITSIA